MSALLNLKQKASSIDFSLESSNWWFKPLTTIWALRYSGLNDNVATLGFMKLYFTRICKITLICLSRDFSLHLLGDVVISCIKEKDKNSHSLAHTANHQMQLWKDIFSSLHRWDFLPHVNWLLLTKKYVIHHVHTHPQYSKPYMFVPSFSELCWPIHFLKIHVCVELIYFVNSQPHSPQVLQIHEVMSFSGVIACKERTSQRQCCVSRHTLL